MGGGGSLLPGCSYSAINMHLKPRLTGRQASCTPWLSLYLPGHFFSIFFAGFPSSSQPLNTSRLRPQAPLLSYLHSPSGRCHWDLLVIPMLTSLVQISPPTSLLAISNVRHPKLSSYHSILNLVLFTDVLTSVNGKSILLVAQNRNPESVFDSPLSLLSYMSNPSGGTFGVVPSKHMRNPTTSQHLHCYISVQVTIPLHDHGPLASCPALYHGFWSLPCT